MRSSPRCARRSPGSAACSARRQIFVLSPNGTEGTVLWLRDVPLLPAASRCARWRWYNPIASGIRLNRGSSSAS